MFSNTCSSYLDYLENQSARLLRAYELIAAAEAAAEAAIEAAAEAAVAAAEPDGAYNTYIYIYICIDTYVCVCIYIYIYIYMIYKNEYVRAGCQAAPAPGPGPAQDAPPRDEPASSDLKAGQHRSQMPSFSPHQARAPCNSAGLPAIRKPPCNFPPSSRIQPAQVL